MAAGAPDDRRDPDDRCRRRDRGLGRDRVAPRRPFGISTVPGFLAAAPVAASGLFGKRTRREQVLFLGGVDRDACHVGDRVAGRHSPQWGGRYLLLPTALLVVLGRLQVRRLGRRPLVVGVVGLGAVMSFVGPRLAHRTHPGVAHFAQKLTPCPRDTVIVSDQPWMGERGRQLVRRSAVAHGGRPIDGRADAEDVAAPSSWHRRRAQRTST